MISSDMHQTMGRMRMRGLQVPERLSTRVLIGKLALAHGRGILEHRKLRYRARLLPGGRYTRVLIKGGRHVVVDRNFARSTRRSIQLITRRFGQDPLSVNIPAANRFMVLPTLDDHKRLTIVYY